MFVQTIARILADTLKLDVFYSRSANTFSIGKDGDGHLVLTMSEKMLAITHESEQRVGTLVRGALAHEALGHGYHTDFDPKSAAKRGAYAASLANAFEDVRIEALAPQRFIGARHILADMAKVIDQHGNWDPPEQRGKWQAALVVALLRKFRTEILHQPLRPEVTAKAVEQARNALGEALYAKVEALAAKACTASSTARVSHYADAIVELLQRQQPSPQPQQASAQRGNGQPQSGQQGNSQPSGRNGQQQRRDGKQPGDSNGRRTAQGGAGKGGVPAFDPQSATDVTIERAMREACAKDATEAVGAVPLLDDTQRMRQEAKAAGGLQASTGRHFKPAGSDSPLANGRLVGRIASRLERVLRSVTEDGEDRETDTGRLNLTRLPGIMTVTERFPFIADGDWAPGIDTELLLLLDSSGSMVKLEKLIHELLPASLLALGRFAPDLGVSFAMFAADARLLIRPGTHLTRPLVRAASRMYTANGGTLWAAATSSLVPVLAESRRRRKILLTVTDGQLMASAADARNAVLADLDAQHIEHPFLSIGVPLPPECAGIECQATPDAFAKAFCQAIVSTMRPEFV